MRQLVIKGASQAEPSLLSCAPAGSAFYRKVREELREAQSPELGTHSCVRKRSGPPLELALHLGLLHATPKSLAGQSRGSRGHRDEDGTSSRRLRW